MRFETTYQTFSGPVLPAMRTRLNEDEAHRTIGANLLAGSEPIVHTKDARGEQLRTRDGRPLTVVALYRDRLVSVVELVHV
ncbi:hypothetical protein [Streptomyces aureus]|uniref:hypothetical protein n=1 Tax=Streptomyces aureus TaxID=193461 RepID=UPI0036831ECE